MLGSPIQDWRNAALRVGEELAPDGPDGYYEMTPEQWTNWALAELTRDRRKRQIRDEGQEHKLPGLVLLIMLVTAFGLWVLIWVL